MGNSKSNGARRRPLRAFTLIELLVVIAIISILMAILIPSLNNARFFAKQVVCQTNLRGVALAMQVYLGDYKGQYPLLHFPSGSPEFAGSDWGSGYYIWSKNMAVDYFDASYRGQYPIKILHCPLDERSCSWINSSGELSVITEMRTYGMNIEYRNKRECDVRSPVRHLLLSESTSALINPFPTSFVTSPLLHLHSQGGDGEKNMCLMGDYSVTILTNIGNVSEDPVLWFPTIE